MPTVAHDPNTIRILVSTDNHVGYNERDEIRGDDSWKSFHEVMCLAKDQDVDMVLLAGDLFHENKPSRKSMYHVMRSLRMACYGNRPCELEMLSDATENFQGAFNHANYLDPDINVSLPVFSIHGNHDDPSGEGHLAALDLLQISGLLNYYGRTPESDNIVIKPVLLQKGHTKLALFGMSNVRDERLNRSFREGKVRFFRPTTQKENWFNLMSVHQNHHKYTETGYLPENFLPDFLDLVIWGHEHECLIDPRYNPVQNFHVMQPGSSVATSLVPGEAVPKYVAILSINGKEFKTENIRLKTVRPFLMKEIVLQDEPGMKSIAKKDSNRTDITRYLEGIVNKMIEKAKTDWLEAQDSGSDDEEIQIPRPLIRLRVEYTAPEGGKFDVENPQRFSNRFNDHVANVNDVVQFYRKKTGATRKSNDGAEMPEASILAELSIDTVKVEKLVREFLTAQSLTILPQNLFGDAVSQFVDKDDKHAMELFVHESLANQIKHLVNVDEIDDDDIPKVMETYRTKLEELFAAGHLKRATNAKLKPKPTNWDSDLDGDWADQPGAYQLSDQDVDVSEDINDDDDFGSVPLQATAKGRAKITSSTNNKATSGRSVGPTKVPVAARASRSKRSTAPANNHDDVVMLDDDSEPALSISSNPKLPAKQTSSRNPLAKTLPTKAPPSTRSSARQSTLNFSQPSSARSNRTVQEVSEDEISDDSDAFEPVATTRAGTRRK